MGLQLPRGRPRRLHGEDGIAERNGSMTAKDIMTRDVVTVGPTLAVKDLAKVLDRKSVV